MMAQDSILLALDGLNAFYGPAQVLFDVSLKVNRGEVVALMGRNGAGKSTTFKAIMGLLRRREGNVCFMGRDISRLATHRIARLGLGYVPEDRRVFTELSVTENLEAGRQAPRPGAHTWTTAELFDVFPNLAEMTERPGGSMSGGEQQMLTVARTLMGNPYLVLLDEPSEGVSPVIVERMANMILGLKKQGLAALLSEQNLPFANAVSDRAYVLEKGQIRFTGSMTELTSNESIRRAYLTV